MSLQVQSSRSLISRKLVGAFFAVFALILQPLVALNVPSVFANTNIQILHSENFTNYDGSLATVPAGWTFTNVGFYTSTNGSSLPNSLKLVEGTGVMTASAKLNFPLAANQQSTQLTFNTLSNGASSGSVLSILESVDGATWTLAKSYAGTDISTTNETKTVSLKGDTQYIDFSYAKETGNIMIDNVTVTGVSDTTPPAAPVANVPSGSYVSAQTVTLSSTDADFGLKEIRYTTDGTTPTASSTLYSAPFAVSNTQVVKAIAYDNAGNASAVSEYVYNIAPAATIWKQGFESDTTSWTPWGGGSVSRVQSRSNGIQSASELWHAQVNGSAYTNWGSYSGSFPTGGYHTEQDVYLDMAQSVGPAKQISFSSAINNTSATHRRDFVLHLTTSGATPGQWLVNASNNTPGTFTGPGVVSVGETGWYTIQHKFYDLGGGVLAVDVSLIRAVDGYVVKTWTLSDSSDIIGVTVGGNRYGWFVINDVSNLAIDNTRIGPAPQPTIIDTDGPTVTIDDPSSDGYVRSLDGSYKIAGTVSDGSGVGLDRMKIQIKDTTTDTVVVSPTLVTDYDNEDWSYDVSAGTFVHGHSYTITLNAYDAWNNRTTERRKVTIDNVKPNVFRIDTPADYGSVSSSFTVTGKAFDNDSGIATVRYNVRNIDSFDGSTSGAAVIPMTPVDTYDTTSGDWTFEIVDLPGGYYRIAVQGIDEVGNSKARSIDVYVDTVGPVVELSDVSRNNNGTYTLLGSTNEQAMSVAVTINGGTTQYATINGLAWEYVTPQLGDGTYPVEIVAYDQLGNVSEVFNYNLVAFTPFTPVFEPTVDPIATSGGASSPGALSTGVTFVPQVNRGVVTPADNQDDSGEVLGTSDTADEADDSEPAPAVEASEEGWKFWGMAWYWWVLLIGALGAAGWAGAKWYRARSEV